MLRVPWGIRILCCAITRDSSYVAMGIPHVRILSAVRSASSGSPREAHAVYPYVVVFAGETHVGFPFITEPQIAFRVD